MRLEAQNVNRHTWPEHQSDCGMAAQFSRMWSSGIADAELLPVYGPHVVPRVLEQSAVTRGLLVLAQTFRDLCLFDPERTELEIVNKQCEDDLQRLADSGFYFKNSRLVCQFLEQHRFLVPILFEVREKFNYYFGVESKASLEIFTDPEDNNSTPKLFALVLTALSSVDASTRLARLDQEWWLDQPREVRRVLNIDVDYIDGV